MRPVNGGEYVLESHKSGPYPCPKGIDWNDRPGVRDVHTYKRDEPVQPQLPGDGKSEKGVYPEERGHADKDPDRKRGRNLAGGILHGEYLPDPGSNL